MVPVPTVPTVPTFFEVINWQNIRSGMENQFHKDANAVTRMIRKRLVTLECFFCLETPGEVKLVENGCFFKKGEVESKTSDLL